MLLFRTAEGMGLANPTSFSYVTLIRGHVRRQRVESAIISLLGLVGVARKFYN